MLFKQRVEKFFKIIYFVQPYSFYPIEFIDIITCPLYLNSSKFDIYYKNIFGGLSSQGKKGKVDAPL